MCKWKESISWNQEEADELVPGQVNHSGRLNRTSTPTKEDTISRAYVELDSTYGINCIGSENKLGNFARCQSSLCHSSSSQHGFYPVHYPLTNPQIDLLSDMYLGIILHDLESLDSH